MICPKCRNKLILKFNPSYKGSYSFYWECTANPQCNYQTKYVVPENRIDFTADFDPKKINTNELNLDNEYTVQMVETLTHFIICGWGAHYMFLFDTIIKDHLKDKNVLDYVLKSNIIKDKVVIVGVRGARIFPDLLKMLRQVNSVEIQEYLDREFKDRV